MYSRPSNISAGVWTIGGLALSVMATPCSVLAQDSGPPGQVTQEGALFLLLPVGAQAIGVARAMTALPSAEGAFWNPAGLASVDRSQVLLYHGNHLTGNGTGFSALFTRPGTGTLGVSYNLLDESGIDVTDDIGMVVGSIAVRGHQGILSVAFPALSWLSAGLNAKFVSSGVTCRGQCPEGTSGSNTYAFDAGVQLQPVPDRPLYVGVMVAHVGPDFNEGNTGQARASPVEDSGGGVLPPHTRFPGGGVRASNPPPGGGPTAGYRNPLAPPCLGTHGGHGRSGVHPRRRYLRQPESDRRSGSGLRAAI